ncbi:alpha-1,2-mannosidase [Nocardia sp. NRRL S-836]|nr:GH92 family glycosyl hydrolase [Nocardia sp. NRRL S-836]KOV88345.1 alpha-1,2-mannosidase [Nocardia sp. NRRL S-836]
MRCSGVVVMAAALVLAAPVVAAAAPATAPPPLVADPTAYVDPFIGTGKAAAAVGEINNFPGPAVPFGMVQFSPDTLDSYAGYQYHDDRIRGFSLTHASVGCSAFGDVPILPITGEVGERPWDRTEHYRHTGEQGEPGYYAVTLEDSNVRAELTATTRTGLATFTLPADGHVLVKGGASLSGNSAAEVTVENDTTITGSASTGGFCGKPNSYTVHYAITFDRPFTATGTWDGTAVTPGGTSVRAPKAGAYLSFPAGQVKAKVALSYVGVDGAKRNMAQEVPHWDAGQVRADTRARWRTELSKIRVAGTDTGELKTFYTALYHSLMHPNTFNDVDGRYPGFDDEVHTLPAGRTQYANFSDWDTYRSLAPLHAMLWPREASDMAQSLVNDAVQGGWWPRWPLANDYTGQMTGDSSVPLIANLHAYGARDFDFATALRYLVKGATSVDTTPGAYRERPGITEYVRRGYLPNTDVARGDHARVGASITLEWSVDDFAIAQLARAAGDRATAAEFTRRGQNWQNLFNPATRHVQPRDGSGRFPDGPAWPPAAGGFGQDGFDEGNAVQYSWMVPHNPAGLITAMGGRDAAAARLDAFTTKLNAGPSEPYMWAGNEPAFGIPWLYNHTGRPWRTQQVVRQIMTTLFSPTPDGEPGNDDLGAQSSWYVWAALGLYPATPGTADLAVHSPLFPRIVLDLPGRDLTINAPNASATAMYVHDLDLDGRDHERTGLPRTLVGTGGVLDFDLRTTPDRDWATDADEAPPSYRDGEHDFLASAGSMVTVRPGGTADLTVSALRLAGDDRTVSVTGTPPAGITVTGPPRFRLADGQARFQVSATAPEGYYDVPLTITGARRTVTTTVTVLVAPEGSLVTRYDNTGIADDGDRSQANLDGAGNSHSRQALADAGLTGGGQVEVGGTRFTWPAAPPGRTDNVTANGQTVALPGGPTRLVFVGAASNGDHRGTATVTFTDGTTAEADLSFGDWVLPGGSTTEPVFGNTVVAHPRYRNVVRGGTGPAFVFATTPFQAPDGKAIASVTLAKDRQLHVFAIGTA